MRPPDRRCRAAALRGPIRRGIRRLRFGHCHHPRARILPTPDQWRHGERAVSIGASAASSIGNHHRHRRMRQCRAGSLRRHSRLVIPAGGKILQPHPAHQAEHGPGRTVQPLCQGPHRHADRDPVRHDLHPVIRRQCGHCQHGQHIGIHMPRPCHAPSSRCRNRAANQRPLVRRQCQGQEHAPMLTQRDARIPHPPPRRAMSSRNAAQWRGDSTAPRGTTGAGSPHLAGHCHPSLHLLPDAPFLSGAFLLHRFSRHLAQRRCYHRQRRRVCRTRPHAALQQHCTRRPHCRQRSCAGAVAGDLRRRCHLNGVAPGRCPGRIRFFLAPQVEGRALREEHLQRVEEVWDGAQALASHGMHGDQAARHGDAGRS